MKKMKKVLWRKVSLHGYLSVEASLVFPFGMAVIGAVCWMGVFRYNLAVLRLTGQEAIGHMTEFRELDEAQFERELVRYVQEKTEARTLACTELHTEIKRTRRKIILELGGVQRLVFAHPLYAEVSYTYIDPEAAVLTAASVSKGE